MCLANIFEEGDRRRREIQELERMIYIAKADEEVLKRVLCGATDVKDFEYLTERLKQVTP